MADLKHYRQIIENLLTKLYSYEQQDNSYVESQLIFDRENDHYLMVDVGWDGKIFIYGTIVHIDIKGNKIWIQRNNTEINLADQLVEQGVSKQSIVLGLHSPFIRKASGYAVN